MTKTRKFSRDVVHSFVFSALIFLVGFRGGADAFARPSKECIGFLQTGLSRETIFETEQFLEWLKDKQSDPSLSRQRQIAQTLVAHLRDVLGVSSRVFEFYSSESRELQVAVKVLTQESAESGGHWMTRLAKSLQKRGISLVLDLQRKDAFAGAWFSDEIKALGIPVSDILYSLPSPVAIHELVHLQHTLDQKARRAGSYTQRQYMPQMFIRSRLKFRDSSLQRTYGGAIGHWVEEHEAYLKEARAHLAYANAAWHKYLENSTPQSKRKVLWHLKEVRGLLKDFDGFYRLDSQGLDLLLQNADALETSRYRNEVILEWTPPRARSPLVEASFQFVPGEAPIDSVRRQRKYMEQLWELSQRVRFRFRELEREIKAHRRR